MAFDRSFPQSLASQAIANSEHFWPRLRFSPLRLKNAASFGSRDYDLRLPYAYSDPLPTSGGRTLQFAYGHKLSLTAALSLTPTPPAAPTVSARFRSAVNPKPPLAIPSRRCRSASFLPPIAQMPYCQPRSSHPQRKKPPTFQALGTFLSFIVCDAMPTPGRYAVRRCTDSTPAVGQPLHSLRVCLWLRARAGRHIVLVQAHDKVPVAPCLRDTCCLL